MKRLFWICAATVVVLLVAARCWRTDPVLRPTPGVVEEARRTTSSAVTALTQSNLDNGRIEAPLVVGPHTPSGELVVDVTWPEGGVADGVDLVVEHCGGAPSRLARLITGADGRARVSLPAGKVRVRALRDDSTVEGDVRPSETCTVSLRLSDGEFLDGRVVDRSREPVPGAVLWLLRNRAAAESTIRIGRADAHGAFRIGPIPGDSSLAATAAGFAPSPPISLADHRGADGRPASTIELVVGTNGVTLIGTVVDPTGTPLRSATVAVKLGPGKAAIGVDGVGRAQWGALTDRTDQAGRFEFAGVPAAKLALEVWHPEYPIARESPDVPEDQVVFVEVRMQAGGILHGTVSLATGPLSGAVVRGWPEPISPADLHLGRAPDPTIFGRPETRTDDAGRFRLRVPAGDLHAYAAQFKASFVGGPEPWAYEAFTIAPGAAIEWNAVVEPVNAIRGTVVYAGGSPASVARVSIRPPEAASPLTVYTDSAGRFSFVHVPVAPHDLEVSPPLGTEPILTRREIWPSSRALVLELPTEAPNGERARVVGQIRNGTSVPGHELRIQLWHAVRGAGFPIPVEDGAFEFTNVTPGKQRLAVVDRRGPVHVSDVFDVASGAIVDVGILDLHPLGSLRLNAERPPALATAEPHVYVRPLGALFGRSVELGANATTTVSGLGPGKHLVSVEHDDLVPFEAVVDIQSHAVTDLTLSLQPRVEFRIALRFDGQARRVSIRTGADIEVWSADWDIPRVGPIDANVKLWVGDFVCRLSCEDGRLFETAFSIAPGASPANSIICELR